MKKRIWGIFAAGLFFPTFSIYCQNTPSPLTKPPALIPGQRISPPSKLNKRINERKPTIPVVSDRDGDGVQDSYDRCPDEKGEKRNFGCPPTSFTIKAGYQLEIYEGDNFRGKRIRLEITRGGRECKTKNINGSGISRVGSTGIHEDVR